jgi:hypothetical protein
MEADPDAELILADSISGNQKKIRAPYLRQTALDRYDAERVEVVWNAELPSAASLGSLQLNISGIIGPALGGLLVAWIGPNLVFALNAACFLIVILAILQSRKTTGLSRTGLESFFVSFVTAIRYVRYAPGLQIVLARNALFALFISLIPALMPVLDLNPYISIRLNSVFYSRA